MSLLDAIQAEIWFTVVAHQRACENGWTGLAQTLENYLTKLSQELTSPQNAY